ncbi:MAG: chromosome segregation ATPase [Melioribacteraceae bacterium]|nr:MAG: chromosome segregation ATPase [Melioribacteraceae bacterium]
MDPTIVIIVLSLIIIGQIVFIYIIHKKKTGLESQLLDYAERYSGIIDVDEEIRKKNSEFNELVIAQNEKLDILRNDLEQLKSKYSYAHGVYDDLVDQNRLLTETLEFAEYGVYNPTYNFDTSEEFKQNIDKNRERQKEYIKNEDAAKCYTNWSVGSSQKKGEIMTRRAIKLTLRAFNGECDALIAKVKWNNINQYAKRIEKVFDAINKMNKSNDIHIQSDYLDLKLEELKLTYEYQLKKHEEKEEQRRIREEMREEEKARREYETAIKEAEKEEKIAEKAILKMRLEMEKARAEEREAFESKLEDLAAKLKIAQEKNARAKSMAEQTKAGHVYIISNVGSFGENVYKIGMTRRLEPLDRVKELGDASVPFRFDVHAMIYSENAPELETSLHQAFTEKRLNFVNTRREYFHLEIDEIIELVKREHGEIEFVKVPEAKEYRESQIIRANLNKEIQDNQVIFPTADALFE